MRFLIFSLCLVLYLACTLINLQAQSIQSEVSVTSGNANGAGGGISYSVGQVTYLGVEGTVGSINEGIQQPYEITVITFSEEGEDLTIAIQAYPNPTTDYLRIVNTELNAPIIAEVYDQRGQLILIQDLDIRDTVISLSALPPSVYLLRIKSKGKESKKVKIVKI